MSINTNWQRLVTQFRPIYKLHSEEMFYPMHFEDLMACMDLVRVDNGKVNTIIPFHFSRILTPETALATDTGIQILKSNGINLDDATINDLRPKATSSPNYSYLQLDQRYFFRFNAFPFYMPPFGKINSLNFTPQKATWYHKGMPNFVYNWLPQPGLTNESYANAVITDTDHNPAQKEPELICWVQNHIVAGIEYVDLIYTCYFGYNGSISIVPGQGEHFNDIVTNIVRFNASDLNTPVRYCFAQHGGFAWYLPDQVNKVGEQMVVYLARQSHESYPFPATNVRLFGLANDLTDDGGVTWTPDALYVNRPQGIDANGVNTDALRCSINPQSPGDVVLIPKDNPGPLWQYVRFRFIQLGGDGINTDLISQGAPLFTNKWWPDEGPVDSTGPLSLKAGERSAIGIPDTFFNNVAPYLGPDPKPTCQHVTLTNGNVSLTTYKKHDEFRLLDSRHSKDPEYLSSSLIDMANASLTSMGADQKYLDWAGPVGSSLINGVQSFAIPLIKSKLTDPMIIPSPWSYTIEKFGIPFFSISLSDLSISGLHGLQILPVTAGDSRTLKIQAADSSLIGTGSLLVYGLTVGTVNVVISNISLKVDVDVLTPIAKTSQVPAQWYVPYIGPIPYSFGYIANEIYSLTKSVSHANVTNLNVVFGDLHVSISGLAGYLLGFYGVIIASLASFFRDNIANELANTTKDKVNSVLDDIYSGAMRVA